MTWLERIRALGPMIDAAAAANPDAAELSPSVVSALDEAGVFALSDGLHGLALHLAWRLPHRRGAARRVLDEWLTFAKGKPRAGGKPMSEIETFQRDFAHASADLAAADAYLRATVTQLYAGLDDALVAVGQAGLLSTSHTFAAAMRISTTAFASCTTQAIRKGSPLQRAFRDIHAGNAHFLTAEQSWIDAGKVLAGAEGAMLIF